MSAPRPWIRTAVPGAVVFFLCALLFIAAATASSRGGAASTAGPDPAEGLRRLHAAIEAAFQRCDHTQLRAAFSNRVKTLLSSKALGVRQGYYGADQALLILRRGFEGRTTLRFKLADLDDTTRQEARPAVRARWLYRDEGASKSEARLSFTLALEGGTWCIREIRELK
jgi:hypothetical protein